MKMRLILPFLLGLVFFISNSAQANRISYQEYIEQYKNIAMQEMKSHKIPASITLAQGLLESGAGNSRLAVEGNNHFGIKCKKNWTGRTIIEDDDEIGECFRAYNSPFESYEDHSLFLTENKRYAFLFDIHILDYKAWADGLLKAGYATNQKYPQLLIGLIERFTLAQYDTSVFYGQKDQNYFTDPIIKPNIQIVDNGVPLTVTRPGQTIHSIAEDNNMRDWQIYKYNDLPKDARIDPGMIIYLKPKRNKAAIATHTVESGETMWEISQKYGIKLKKLYKKNHMEPGTEVKPGEVINMRRKRKEMPDTGRVIIQPSLDIPSTESNHIEVVTPPTTKPIQKDVNTGTTTTTTTTSVAESNTEGTLFYTVSIGETLYSISKKLNISMDSLAKWNKLKDNALYVGQRLSYFAPQTQNQNSNNTTQTRFILHTIKPGETLYSISRIYGVSVEQIQQWNQISGNDIRVGQTLQIEDNR
ncbi:MAG: LysM peptidoglycan-binding domain-containing protein [Bacteroidia bacterium]|nr:LysM peptidoglycan-binding domain-containing protein [Bacteroidia bacterium]